MANKQVNFPTDPADTLTCRIADRPATAAIYTKRDADALSMKLHASQGGIWSVEKVGTKYRVYQKLTKQERLAVQEHNLAQAALDPRCDPLNPDSSISIYRIYDNLKKRLDDWQSQFSTNPSYALRCATETFQVAGEYEVICIVIDHHKKGATLQNIVEHLEDIVTRNNKYGSLSCSTSPTANLMEDAMCIATAKYACELRANLDARAKAAGVLYATAEGLL